MRRIRRLVQRLVRRPHGGYTESIALSEIVAESGSPRSEDPAMEDGFTKVFIGGIRYRWVGE